MTRAELITLMRTAWTGDAASGLSSPLTTAQTAMINAQLGAVADGILAGGGGGGGGGSLAWARETFTAAGTTFELAHAPTSGSVFAFINGWAPDFSVADKTVTLAESKSADDVLVVRYQYAELT